MYISIFNNVSIIYTGGVIYTISRGIILMLLDPYTVNLLNPPMSSC